MEPTFIEFHWQKYGSRGPVTHGFLTPEDVNFAYSVSIWQRPKGWLNHYIICQSQTLQNKIYKNLKA